MTAHDSARTKWGTVFEPGVHRAVVTGYGYTGQRLVAALHADGVPVTVLARRNDALDEARVAGATTCFANLDEPATLAALDARNATLFHLAPPPATGTSDTRTRALLNALDTAPPARIVLVSTTGVYGDHAGNSVTERSPVSPETDRGRRRLDAETVASAFADARGIPLVVLRVAGIYGPDRLPLERLRRRDPLPANEHCGLTNRIHVDDMVRALQAAANYRGSERFFNVCDGSASPMREWFERVASHAGLPAPPLISVDEARRVLSPMLLSFLSASRRIDNRLLREELGVELEFADPETGIAAALSASVE